MSSARLLTMGGSARLLNMSGEARLLGYGGEAQLLARLPGIRGGGHVALPGMNVQGGAEAILDVDVTTFNFRVKTNNAGTSSSTSFTFPASSGTYDIDWGDGNVDLGVSGSQTHDYGIAGEYDVTVSNGIRRVLFNNGGDRLKMLEISQWGDAPWTSSFQNAFQGCANLIVTATDAPDLGTVSTITNMFNGCTSLTADLSSWDVSFVQQFSATFSGCTNFTSDLSSWNVGSAVNFSSMFRFCTNFTSDLSSWNTPNVSSFAEMFRDCVSFTSDLSGWDVSSGANFSQMFRGAALFTTDMGAWDVTAATNMGIMLFNSGLTTPHYDASLIAWSALVLKPAVAFRCDPTKYSAGAAAAARASIISTYGWTITDGGLA